MLPTHPLDVSVLILTGLKHAHTPELAENNVLGLPALYTLWSFSNGGFKLGHRLTA